MLKLLYKKMTPQLLNVKMAGSPKGKAYSYRPRKRTKKKCIVRTYKDSFRIEYKTAD